MIDREHAYDDDFDPYRWPEWEPVEHLTPPPSAVKTLFGAAVAFAIMYALIWAVCAL